MVATFFLQRTTAFILFLIVPSLQISCFRKTKEKQYAKYDLNKHIAARLIWQLVIHSSIIFALIISRRDGENNGFLAAVFFPPSLLSRPSRKSLAPKTPFPFPLKRLPRRLGLPSSGFDVIKADVIVSSVVVETDFDAGTADIIVESGVLVSIGVI